MLSVRFRWLDIDLVFFLFIHGAHARCMRYCNGAEVDRNLWTKICVDGLYAWTSCRPRPEVILHATPRRLVNVKIKAMKLRYTCVKKSN